MGALSMAAIAAITGFGLRFFYERIYKEYQPGISLFSWHPTFMILGQLVILESIFIFKYLPRGWRVTIHGIIGGLGTTLLCGGFYAIYQNKINLNKSHFTSWHGLFGVSTVILMITQSLFGTILKYGKKLLQSIGIAKLVKVSHRFNGLFSGILSFLVVFLATEDWFYVGTVAIPSAIYITFILLKIKMKEKKSKLT